MCLRCGLVTSAKRVKGSAGRTVKDAAATAAAAATVAAATAAAAAAEDDADDKLTFFNARAAASAARTAAPDSIDGSTRWGDNDGKLVRIGMIRLER